MKLYKLMKPDHTTRNEQKWEIGMRVEKAPCDNPRLCSEDVLHAYTNLNLAFMLAPLHGTGDYPVVAECEGDVVVSDWGKVGCIAITPVRWIDRPAWVWSGRDTQVRVAFAALCAEAVIDIYNAEYPSEDAPRRAIMEAKAWLANPSIETAARAVSAADAASYAANSATYAASYAASYAADAASYAARAASGRATSTRAVSLAARAVARATDARTIDFTALADEAVRMVYDA